MQQVVRLSGSPEHVDFGVVAGAQFERNVAFSVSFWFRARTSADIYRSIISCMDAAGVGWTCRLVSSGHSSGTAGVLQFLMAGATQTRDVYWSNGALDDRRWHHVVVTSDGVDAAGVNVTVDGVAATTTASDTLTSETTIGTSPQLVLGAHQPAGSDFFFGEVTHAAVWNTELNASEVDETWQGGLLVNLVSHSAYGSAVVYVRMFADTYPTLIDAKGTANGTLTGMDIRDLVLDQPPVCGVSAKFEGVNDIAATGSTSEYGFERTNTFSALCWVRSNSSGFLVGKMTSSGLFPGWGMYLQADGTVAVALHSDFGGGDLLAVSTDDPVNDGDWHCLLFTYDGSSIGAGVTIYVDGTAVAVTVDTDALTASIVSSAELTLGARFGGDLWFTGLMSGAAVYDAELTAGEAVDVYGAGTPPHLRDASMPANLVGYWKMGDWDSVSTLRDFSINSNDLTTAGMAAGNLLLVSPPNARAGVATKSARFNDELDEVLVSTNVALYEFQHTDSYSFATWVNALNLSTFNCPILSTKEADSGGSGYILRVRGGVGSRHIEFVITGSAGDDTDEIAVRSDSEFTHGVWRHIAVTYDGSTAAAGVTLYLDGVVVDVSVITDTLSTAPGSTQALVIGNRITNNNKYFDGDISDVRVYGRELMAEEVRELASSRVVHSALDSVLSGWLLGWWRMGDDGNISTVTDDSPYSSDAVATGLSADTVWSFVPETLAFPSEQIPFDGVSQWAEAATDTPELKFERSDEFSVSFWYHGAPSGDVRVVNNRETGTTRGWAVRIRSSGVVSFYVINVAVTDALEVETTVSVGDDALHHVLVTYDGSSAASGVAFYIDGQAASVTVNSDTLTTDIAVGHTTPLNLGRAEWESFFDSWLLEGIVHDVAIYDRVLNVAEVLAVYGDGSGADLSLAGSRESLVSWWRLALEANRDGADFFGLADSGVRYYNPLVSEGIHPYDGDIPEDEAIDIGQDVGIPVNIETYSMRALADPGPGYTTWVSVGAPDPSGDDAPGSIVGGSAVVVGHWGQDKVTVPA